MTDVDFYKICLQHEKDAGKHRLLSQKALPVAVARSSSEAIVQYVIYFRFCT